MPQTTQPKSSRNRYASKHRTLSIKQARCVVLHALGFGSARREHVTSLNAINPNQAPGWRILKKQLHNMGTLQIDAINTIIRSHYMPLYSRVGSYSRESIDKHLFDPSRQKPAHRQFFEYWGHECSLMPIELYPELHWRMLDARKHIGMYKQCAAIAKQQPAFVRNIKAALKEGGPALSRELERHSRGPGMWEWSKTKQALEYLFWTGEISTRGRVGFQRLYDLTERTIPSHTLDACTLSREDAQAELLFRSVKALGIGTSADIRDYFRLSAKDTQAGLQRLLEEQRIEQIDIEGWDQSAYWVPETRVPRKCAHTCLLTPFDPLVWQRQRLKRLFDFDYRIEIYVPAEQRQYGYYVLPFLHEQRIAGRVDLKADREHDCLQVLGVWWEHDKPDDVEAALQSELHLLREWLGLADLMIKKKCKMQMDLA